MSFRSGLLIGGLGVAVVALVVAVVVLALGGSSDSDDSAPTVVVGTPTSESDTTTKKDTTEETDAAPAPAHPEPDNLPTMFFETPSGTPSRAAPKVSSDMGSRSIAVRSNAKAKNPA